MSVCVYLFSLFSFVFFSFLNYLMSNAASTFPTPHKETDLSQSQFRKKGILLWTVICALSVALLLLVVGLLLHKRHKGIEISLKEIHCKFT